MRSLSLLAVLTVLLSACGGAPAPAPRAASSATRARRRSSVSTVMVSGVAIGEPAPELALENQDGELRHLSEFLGHPVILFFYPRDSSPCTAEACGFRDAWARIQARGAVVLGVSTDDAHAHRAYREANALPFELLSDHHEAATATYGIPTETGFITNRETFLIDAAGNVVEIWFDLDDVGPVLTMLEALP